MTHDIAQKLDEADVPRSAGRDVVRRACADLDIKLSNAALSAVVRFRKDQGE